MKTIAERVKAVLSIAPQDIATADVTGATYQPMADYRRVRAVLVTSTIAATKVATVQLMQATDAAGTGAKALGALVSVAAPTGGQAMEVEAEVQASDLDTDNGYAFVSVTVGTDDPNATPPTGAAILEFADGRYGTSV